MRSFLLAKGISPCGFPPEDVSLINCKTHETSVPNEENRPQGRKSERMHGKKLPSQTRKTGHRDGSQSVWMARNFRPKRGKQATGTEVRAYGWQETSVPNIENGLPRRKSARIQGAKLPSQMQKRGVRDGSCYSGILPDSVL